jgi:hypothetical protein
MGIGEDTVMSAALCGHGNVDPLTSDAYLSRVMTDDGVTDERSATTLAVLVGVQRI